MDISRTFLESIHPRGTAKAIRTIGGQPAFSAGEGTADVVVVTPTAAQCRNRRWIEVAVSKAVEQLAPDGLVYVLAPPRWRARIYRLFRRHGLVVGNATTHVANGEARYYVPLAPRTLHYAAMTWPLSRRWRHVRLLLHRVPGAWRLLFSGLPRVGFAAVRPGSRAFGWLLSRLDDGGTHVIVATSWRGAQAPALLFAFNPDAAHPCLVVKRGRGPSAQPFIREASCLEQLGPAARKAGINVPDLIQDEQATRNWLLETAVPGRPASRILTEQPAELPHLLDAIAVSLGRWHAGTMKTVELDEERCEHEFLAPARMLSGEIAGGEEYARWIAKAADKLLGQRVPVVSTHGDLTMANLLWDSAGAVGFVDWEEARSNGLPLTDFWYSACDGVSAIYHYRDRPSAFRTCFERGAPYRRLLDGGEQQLRAIVGGPREWLELCFHGCWLQHAANEQARGGTGENRPFRSILTLLSDPGFRSLVSPRLDTH